MWLKADYDSAWAEIFSLATIDVGTKIDHATTCAILGALALAKGELKLGAMLSSLDESELDEWLEDHFAWSELYK